MSRRTKSLTIALALLGVLSGGLLRAQASASIPSELRASPFSPDKTTLQAALELKHAGWTYIMPVPKSAQARWGNADGRTTWYYGFWSNLKTHSTSSLQPIKDAMGQWVGDEKGIAAWRTVVVPRLPSQIEWLCSTSEGSPPDRVGR